MIIEYLGTSTERIIGGYTFRRDHPCRVTEADLIAEILTQPGEEFAVAPYDPLALLIGAPRAAEMAVFYGVIDVEQYEQRKRSHASISEVLGGGL